MSKTGSASGKGVVAEGHDVVGEIAMQGLVDGSGGCGDRGVDPGAAYMMRSFIDCGKEAVGKEGSGGD